MTTHFTRQFLKTLYPDPVTEAGGRLVLWTRRQGSRTSRSYWVESLDRAVELAGSLRAEKHVYFGVALQDDARALEIARSKRPRVTLRGGEGTAVALPALFADLDVAGEGHRSNSLPPDRDAALALLGAVPCRPSIIVRTGGGFHVYWLLKELWILDSDDERRAAKQLLLRVQKALRNEARRHGWSIDHTADLARLLRLPGTFNHKTVKKHLVVVEELHPDRRYTASSFDALPGSAPHPVPGAPVHLPQGERGKEGESALGKRYEEPEEMDGPADFARVRRGCHHVGFVLGLFDEYCDRCVHFGRIPSPISLGRPDPHPDPLPQRERGPDPLSGEPPLPEEPPPSPGRPPSPERRPILVSTREDEVNQQALEALAASQPNLYERAGTLVQVVTVDVDRPGGRAYGQAVAKPVTEARLRELLAAACDFRAVRRTARGAEERPAHPPIWAVRAVHGRGTWPGLPLLAGVVECPVLRRDGSVLQAPGYDRKSGLYYAPAAGAGSMAAVPSSPTAAEIDAAKALLKEAVCDFPFQSEVHYAGWLSSLLTPLARFAFDGPSPLNLIDANVRGAGKSLLADAVTKILAGREAARTPYTRDEDEFRKSITSLALEGSQTVLIDNVRGAFGSASLECVLTTSIWRDRLLGMNVKVTLPLQIAWFVTGNNIALLGDIPRRCVHIRLESPEERPETREGFRHPRASCAGSAKSAGGCCRRR